MTKKSKSRTIPINDEMKRFWSEMENEKCRERMIDEDETSEKARERERDGEGRSFSSYIKLYNCTYSTPL